MSNIINLETSIHKFLKIFNKLRDERDEAVSLANDIKKELENAQNVIQELEKNINEIEENSNNNERESVKEEIVQNIKEIINRIDSIDIDCITNEE
jgi:flagellar biosynthesis chaperone FliJ